MFLVQNLQLNKISYQLKRLHSILKSNNPVVIKRLVEWGDIDAFQHVNNKVYFKWFESARIDYMRKLDLEAIDISKGVSVILAETSCKYLKPVYFPDSVHISTRTHKLGNTSWIMETDVFSENENMAKVATGTHRVVFYSYDAKKPVPCPQEIRKKIIDIEGIEFIEEVEHKHDQKS